MIEWRKGWVEVSPWPGAGEGTGARLQPAGVSSLHCGADLPHSRETSGPENQNSAGCNFRLWPGTRPMALQAFISLVQKMPATLSLS